MRATAESHSEHLTRTFAALADPTRRAMLSRLSRGEANVSDLAKPFLNEMSLPAITKHLQVLERAKLVTKSREAQYRPCKLNGEAFKDVFNWIEHYRQFWEESFDRLEEYLKTVTGNQKLVNQKSASQKLTHQKSHTQKSKQSKGKKHGRKK